VIIGVFAALWFVLFLYDRISANRRLNHFLPGLLQGVERRDTDHQLSAEQIKAITSAIREPATGARGLTRTTIASICKECDRAKARAYYERRRLLVE
jgi:hypothetical protein